jgi:hypothetical protein
MYRVRALEKWKTCRTCVIHHNEGLINGKDGSEFQDRTVLLIHWPYLLVSDIAHMTLISSLTCISIIREVQVHSISDLDQ